MENFHLEEVAKSYPHIMLFTAALFDFIPDVGPQLIFVFMFANGLIPFSILLTFSMVQDGHGILPLLSYSIRDSLIIKIFNVAYGLITGFVLLSIGI